MCMVVNMFVLAFLVFINSLFNFNHPDAILILYQILQSPLLYEILISCELVS